MWLYIRAVQPQSWSSFMTLHSGRVIMVYLAGVAVVLIGSFAVMNTLLTQQAEPIVSPAPERSAQPPVNKEASPKENVKAQPQPEIISPAPQGPKNNPPA